MKPLSAPNRLFLSSQHYPACPCGVILKTYNYRCYKVSNMVFVLLQFYLYVTDCSVKVRTISKNVYIVDNITDFCFPEPQEPCIIYIVWGN